MTSPVSLNVYTFDFFDYFPHYTCELGFPFKCPDRLEPSSGPALLPLALPCFPLPAHPCRFLAPPLFHLRDGSKMVIRTPRACFTVYSACPILRLAALRGLSDSMACNLQPWIIPLCYHLYIPRAAAGIMGLLCPSYVIMGRLDPSLLAWPTG